MAVQYNPAIVTDGLVLCLDAANRKSYPETGTNWNSAINNFTFTLNNGATFSSASQSFSFDGTNDSASINSSTLNIGSGDFTIDIWYYWISPQTGNFRKVMGSGNYLQPGYVIITNGNTDVPVFGIQYGTSTWNSIGSGTPKINSWNHGVVTRLNGTITVYLNGVNTGSTTDSYNFANATTTIRIGSNGSNSEQFKGNVASVKQYDKGLNAEQVLQNFNALRGRFGI